MKKDYLKKLAALSVAAAMVFSMAACGNTGTGNNAGNASESFFRCCGKHFQKG